MTEQASTKPYLMRALYEWCVDNGYTPYVSVVVDADTRVPVEYVRRCRSDLTSIFLRLTGEHTDA